MCCYIFFFFFLWQHHCFKTNWLLVWPLAVWKIKLSWELLCVLFIWWGECEHAALAEWAEGEVIEHNHSGFLPPVNLQTSTLKSEHWILLVKLSQQELFFSEISKPHQLGEALANNNTFAWESLGKADSSISLVREKPFPCFILWWHKYIRFSTAI